MSYTSQVTNNRSMNGIISFDDGNGGILENGQLTADNSNVVDSQVETLSIENQLNLDGNIKANNLLISPLWVSYLYGLTGNIQSQFNNIVVTLLSNNNNWTGTNTFNNTVNFNGIVNGLTKSTVGLGNVDNTSDLNKPISSATQTALDTKLNLSGGTMTGNVTWTAGNIYFSPNRFIAFNNSTGSLSSRFIHSGSSAAMIWDNPLATSITIRWTASNTTTVLLTPTLSTFSTPVTFTGAITSPTITDLQTQINAIPANFLSSNNNFTGTNQFNNVSTFVGNISANSITITPTVFSRISGLTSDAQTQINGKLSSNFGTGTNLALNNCNIGGTTYFNGNQILTSGNVTDYYLGTAMTSGTQVYINSSNNYIMNHIATNFMIYQWAGVNKHYFFNDGSMTIMGVLSCNYVSCNNDIDTVNLNITGTATGITKTMVGLNNVDNTSDVNKPVSTATQTALNLKANLASPTFSGTVVLPTSYHNGASYFRNYGPTIPPAVSNMFGAITTNYQSGHADVDFWNTYRNSNGATSAFRFYNINADESTSLLFNMLRSGNASILGVLTTAGANLTGALTGTTATFSGAVSTASATLTGALTGTSATFSGAITAASATITGLLTLANVTITNLVTANSYTNTSGSWGVIPSGSVKSSTVVISSSTTFTKSNMPSIITNTSATSIEITLPADLDIGTEFTIINLKLSTLRLTSSNASLCKFYKYVGTIDLETSLDLAQYSTTYVLAQYSGINVWFIKSSFQYPGLSTGKFGAYGAIMGNGNPLNNSQVYYLSLSCQWYNPSSVDDYFIIMPGYILETYSGVNYTGTKNNYANQPLYLVGGTRGTEPKFYHSSNPNTMVSYKLYYFSTASNYGEECAIPGFS